MNRMILQQDDVQQAIDCYCDARAAVVTITDERDALLIEGKELPAGMAERLEAAVLRADAAWGAATALVESRALALLATLLPSR